MAQSKNMTLQAKFKTLVKAMGKPEPSEADERLKMVKTQLADTQPIGSGTLFSNLRH